MYQAQHSAQNTHRRSETAGLVEQVNTDLVALLFIGNLGFENLAAHAELNLAESFAHFGQFDVIFCRNVTIYFRLESTRRVVDNFFESLNPGGYLFIGHSETIGRDGHQYEYVLPAAYRRL